LEIISVAGTIVHHLREPILTGELAPGLRLNETEIANQLGVSRAPLREAFMVLEHDHLIVRQPRHGCYVANMSVEHLEKLYTARSMIESFAIDVFESRKLKSFPKVEEILDVTRGTTAPPLTDRRAMSEYLKKMAQFHNLLIEATENDWVIQFYQSIIPSLFRYQFRCFYIPGLTQNSNQLHEKILDLIKQGNYRLAKKDLLFHINHTASLIKTEIQPQEKEPVSEALA
jgi:DNA-binding GntR family transcriptional regulator